MNLDDTACSRRTFLASSLLAAGLISADEPRALAAPLRVDNITRLYSVPIAITRRRSTKPLTVHQRLIEREGRWTRALIDAALDRGGTYYLPYQPHATREQFERAYPNVGEWKRIKQLVDPQRRLSNEMLARYA